jgi:hypothetical protein
MKIKGALAMLIVGALAAQPMRAQLYSGNVPSNAFIVVGSLDWAWASPCMAQGWPGGSCSAGVNLAGGGGGWGFATGAQWAGRPAVSAFLDPSGNFSGSGGQMRCASGWFDLNNRTNCDYSDAANLGLIDSGPSNIGPGDGNSGDWFYAETWLVRTDPNANVVPEPATMSLIATGLVGMVGAGLRRRKKA